MIIGCTILAACYELAASQEATEFNQDHKIWRPGVSPGRKVFGSSPDGIRTRATALRGRRARPLHNGALARPNLQPRRPDRGSVPTRRSSRESRITSESDASLGY
jgi:hypothetical protein